MNYTDTIDNSTFVSWMMDALSNEEDIEMLKSIVLEDIEVLNLNIEK